MEPRSIGTNDMLLLDCFDENEWMGRMQEYGSNWIEHGMYLVSGVSIASAALNTLKIFTPIDVI